MPPDPSIEKADEKKLKHSVYTFPEHLIFKVGELIGEVITSKHKINLYALAVQSWHTHFVTGPVTIAIGNFVNSVKRKVEWWLDLKQRIWTRGYYKTFCYTQEDALARIKYVQKHNLKEGLDANPWQFITPI